jgi:hypothetical protein
MPVLSRTQQNDVYKLAEAQGLNPLEFDWKIELRPTRGLTEIFIHRPTQSRFDFSDSDEKIWLSWWPKFVDGKSIHFAKAWQEAVAAVRLWITEVKKNDDAPDLWAEARKARQLTDAAADVGAENTPFNPAEIELLKPKLNEIEAYIQSQQPLDEQQKKTLHGRFQYLLGAAKRGVGRIDFLNIFVGQIFQLVTEGVLKSSIFGDVMRHAWTLVDSVIKVGSKLLGS